MNYKTVQHPSGIAERQDGKTRLCGIIGQKSSVNRELYGMVTDSLSGIRALLRNILKSVNRFIYFVVIFANYK